MDVSKNENIWLDKYQATGLFPKLGDVLSNFSAKNQSAVENYTRQSQHMADRSDLLMSANAEHLSQQREQMQNNMQKINAGILSLLGSLQSADSMQGFWQDWLTYSLNSSARLLQTADILRERGDIFVEHEKAGCPPVLDYDYEIIMDASTFERPCNYILLKILPPKGIKTSDEQRPYVIIDPRAGHGGGIGGFKSDSQVGVALADGHPVYFVAFKRAPEPHQTIADITHAEGKFIREIQRRHPKSDAPVIVGNCQGGWATLILAATNPEITGPIVLNGAPVSAWSGKLGSSTLRYKAGLNGGTWQALLSSDLGNGIFDGAWLVNNFESLNPSRSYIKKYYDLYKNPAANRERFLDFERWWGGFFLMNEEEIRWIVENIFIGNRIARNTAQLEKGTHIDLRNIKSPIIVFASHGDNITPPPQAINWILDTYTDESEIEICGQRIIYMVHEQVGHLGIFVSSKIARREHKGIASILEMIEALPPGLFELIIEDYEGEGQNKSFCVDFQRRSFDDVKNALDDGRGDEKAFRAIHRFSKAQTSAYESYLRPYIKSLSNEDTAHWLRAMHPLRLQRSVWNSQNPLAMLVNNLAGLPTQVIENTKKASKVENLTAKQHSVGMDVSANLVTMEDLEQDNVFLQFEKLWMDSLSMSIDFWRDWQNMIQETLFFSIWSSPWLRAYGQQEASRRLLDTESLTKIPTVEKALTMIEEGGLSDAVIRMLLIANVMGKNSIDRDQLMRFTEILSKKKPFSDLSKDALAEMLHLQTIIVRFDKEQAIATLPKLLKTAANKKKAMEVMDYVLGESEDLMPNTAKVLKQFSEKLS